MSAIPASYSGPSERLEYPFDHTSLLATLRDQWDLEKSSNPLSARLSKVPTFRGLIDPTITPIKPKTLTVPKCVWSAGAVRGRDGHPVSEQAVRSILRAIRRSRQRGGH
jgi:hypothetical protein